MKYEEIVSQVKDSLSKLDISDYKNHLAVQVNVTGDGEGAFYIEFSNGYINVEPYEYFDRDAIFTITAEDIANMLSALAFNDITSTNDDVLVTFNSVLSGAKKPVEATVVEDVQMEIPVEPVVVVTDEDTTKADTSVKAEEPIKSTESVEPKKEEEVKVEASAKTEPNTTTSTTTTASTTTKKAPAKKNTTKKTTSSRSKRSKK